jgi:hypothetical protein
MKTMPHPLFALISQQPETALIETPAAASEPSLADASGVAGAGGVGGGGEGVGSGGVHIGLDGPQVPHVAILAVMPPPGQDGTPGVTAWAPGLTLADRREILADDEWFAARVRRREREREQLTAAPAAKE